MSRNLSILPNSLTVGNMFFGFWSIISSIEGDYEWAAYFIIIGGICDALDGKVARLVKSTTDFGVQFDSFADIITFGTAPSVLMYMLYKNIYLLKYPGLEEFAHLIFIISFFPLLFGGIRLARFNSELVGHNKEAFSGLPIPASAMTIVAFVLYELEVYGDIQHLKWLTFTSIVVSYLMVSRVVYHGFPVIFSKDDKPLIKYVKMLLIIIVISLIVKFKMSLLFPLMIIFVITGVIRSVIGKFKKEIEEIEEEEKEGSNNNEQ